MFLDEKDGLDRSGISTKPKKFTNDIKFLKSNVARPKRFELLTPRFVVWCSIQLSYGRPSCLDG